MVFSLLAAISTGSACQGIGGKPNQGSSPTEPNSANEQLVAGQPPLTRTMVSHYRSIYEWLLDIKLNDQQTRRFQMALVNAWKENDTETIQQTVSDLKYYGQKEELETLHQSQNTFIEAFRRDISNEISKIFIEAFDAAHPEMVAGTPAKKISDLTGTWRKSDAVIAEKTSSGTMMGVSYTDSEILEVSPDGKFKHVKVHSHYSGNCSETFGITEYGTFFVEGSKLVWHIESGSTLNKDACRPALNKQTHIKPRTERFTWNMVSNPNNNNEPSLCWYKADNSAICLDKQQNNAK